MKQMVTLFTNVGSDRNLDKAIDSAESDSADIFNVFLSEYVDSSEIEIINITSETVYAEGVFYYILKRLVRYPAAE